MRPAAKLVGSVMVVMVAAACSPTETTRPCPVDGCAVELTADVTYADGRTLDIYAPAEGGDWPVVVVAHGLGQRRETFAALARSIAGSGAVVFNISTKYSVPPLDGINDIACAVRFARATGGDRGGDTTSITLVGNSSGAAKGSIVAMDGDRYHDGCVTGEGSALPTGFVGYEGAYDYGTHLYGGFTVPALKDTDPATWEAVDPYSHIGGNPDLVLRLIHGRDADNLPYDVPPEVSRDFGAALTAAGYDVEIYFVDGASHKALGAPTEVFDLTVRIALDVARR